MNSWEKHEWKIDNTVWESISVCFRCEKCKLTKLIYENDYQSIKTDIKCEGDNNGRFVVNN